MPQQEEHTLGYQEPLKKKKNEVHKKLSNGYLKTKQNKTKQTRPSFIKETKMNFLYASTAIELTAFAGTVKTFE